MGLLVYIYIYITVMSIYTLIWYLISTHIYIPKADGTGRAHEHILGQFWYIYGRAYENPALWCLISTLMYIPKCTGRAHEHTGSVLVHIWACL